MTQRSGDTKNALAAEDHRQVLVANPYPTLASKLAVVILTKNEALNIAKCIGAVPEGIEVFVVDSGSTDQTVELASALNAQILRNAWAGFAEQRNFAIKAIRDRFDWILFIDADEEFSTEFFKWSNDGIESSTLPDVVFVSQRLRLQGKVLRHAPGYPIYHPRLVRTCHLPFRRNAAGHGETVDPSHSVAYIDLPYIHDFFPADPAAWLRKHVDLASQEASMTTDKAGYRTARSRINQLLGTGYPRVLLRFLYHYVVKRGFLDGRAGLTYATLYAWYELTKVIFKRTR